MAVPAPLVRTLKDSAATTALGAEIALFVKPGDVVLLSGDLGAGKTTFARGLIRTLCADPQLDVPSPTFALVQPYDAPRMPVLHADLYRLSHGADVLELGLDDHGTDGLVLIEWPEQADLSWLPGHRLSIALSITEVGHRAVLCVPDGAIGSAQQEPGGWHQRLLRLQQTDRYLRSAGHDQWQRGLLAGDASARRYERLSLPHDVDVSGRAGDAGCEDRILMDSPAMPDPGIGAEPYSRIVHLAEDIRPFLAIGQSLADAGFAVPEIIDADPENGFAILSDLGAGQIIVNNAPDRERYMASMDCLVALHATQLPDAARWRHITHQVPSFDRRAFHAEATLVLDWYIPHVSGNAANDACRHELSEALDAVIDGLALLSPPQTWLLRDYHSPNIIHRSAEIGIARIGLIDFQDALKGPGAYDVASLAYDARIDMPPALTASLIAHYLASGSDRIASFDANWERQRIAAFAAQRNLKILGIFARLAKRDDKPAYLAHLPRIRRYLSNGLGEPALAPLHSWAQEHLGLEGT